MVTCELRRGLTKHYGGKITKYSGYDKMNHKKFSKLYSYSRVSRYVKAANGDKRKAQRMYYANARIAQAFQPLLSFFEVILRNQLHYALAAHFSDVQWLIRTLRNRVSHNEPLCFKDKAFDMAYAKDMYVMISNFLGWISPEIMVSLRNESLDGVSSEIAKAEAILVSG